MAANPSTPARALTPCGVIHRRPSDPSMRPARPALSLAFAWAFAASASATGGEARPFSHDLKPGAIAEECLRLEAGRARAFEWTSDAPVDFNIHYHRGDKVSYPVKVAGRSKGRGRFTAASTEDYCWMWSAKGAAKVTGRLGPQE